MSWKALSQNMRELRCSQDPTLATNLGSLFCVPRSFITTLPLHHVCVELRVKGLQRSVKHLRSWLRTAQVGHMALRAALPQMCEQ